MRSGVATSAPFVPSSLFSRLCKPTTGVGRLFGDDGIEGSFRGGSLIGGEDAREPGIDGAAGSSG